MFSLFNRMRHSFQGGPYYDALHSLLGAYVCYRPDVGYVCSVFPTEFNFFFSFMILLIIDFHDFGIALFINTNIFFRPFSPYAGSGHVFPGRRADSECRRRRCIHLLLKSAQ